MTNANTTALVIKFVDICSDGSGAPALVTFRGGYYQVDFLGKAVVRNLRDQGRSPSKGMITAIEKEYVRKLRGQVNEEWFSNNRDFYG